MLETHPAEGPAPVDNPASPSLISTSNSSNPLVLTTISARISSRSGGARDDGGGGFRLAATTVLPPLCVAWVCVLFVDTGRVDDGEVGGLEGSVGEETLGVAVLLLFLFPLLFCPNRVAREIVPIMLIRGIVKERLQLRE